MSTAQTPPGWYPDPSGSGGQRYWDGSQWTEHYSSGTAPAPAPAYAAPVAAQQPAGPVPSLWWGAPVATLLLLIGAVGPWVSADVPLFGQSLSANGLDRDGSITLLLGIVAGVLLVVWRQKRAAWAGVVAAVLGALTILIAIIDIADVSGKSSDVVDLSVGWGLWLTLVGAIVLTVVSVLLTVRRA
jgi:hypothetical protein